MKKLTVFTPTYNREALLPRAYYSLKKQTNMNFEWLIVDDGSTDRTSQLCTGWVQEETAFPIRYIKKENGGKCSAINEGLKYAEGEWFLTLDSDDYLTEDAVEKIVKWINLIPQNGTFCAIAGRATYGGSEPDAPALAGDYQDCSFLDRYPRKKNHYFFIGHDRPWVFRTEIHRRYPYPIFAQERFMTEAVAWNRMAHDGYLIRCFNDTICIYEHQTAGLTDKSAENFLRNPRGYGLWQWELAQYLNYSIVKRFQQIYTLSCDMGNRCSDTQKAEFIHTNIAVIFLCKALKYLRDLFRRAS